MLPRDGGEGGRVQEGGGSPCFPETEEREGGWWRCCGGEFEREEFGCAWVWVRRRVRERAKGVGRCVCLCSGWEGELRRDGGRTGEETERERENEGEEKDRERERLRTEERERERLELRSNSES